MTIDCNMQPYIMEIAYDAYNGLMTYYHTLACFAVISHLTIVENHSMKKHHCPKLSCIKFDILLHN